MSMNNPIHIVLQLGEANKSLFAASNVVITNREGPN